MRIVLRSAIIPINAIWEDETQTIYRLDISTNWGWTELEPILIHGVEQGNRNGYAIVLNYIGRLHMPSDMLAIGGQATKLIAPYLFAVVSVVGSNLVLQTINAAFRLLYAAQLECQFLDVKTLDDARAWIREYVNKANKKAAP
ncbi:MAG: hypothetical protein SGI73_12375 [Chloroflexota bacterium]|nr:hypothetical protein [Chloroflexota bacterium]